MGTVEASDDFVAGSIRDKVNPRFRRQPKTAREREIRRRYAHNMSAAPAGACLAEPRKNSLFWRRALLERPSVRSVDRRKVKLARRSTAQQPRFRRVGMHKVRSEFTQHSLETNPGSAILERVYCVNQTLMMVHRNSVASQKFSNRAESSGDDLNVVPKLPLPNGQLSDDALGAAHIKFRDDMNYFQRDRNPDKLFVFMPMPTPWCS
jgi:hypothetical protein